MDATEDWEQHFLSRANSKRNVDRVARKHKIIIISKGGFDKEKRCVPGRVISEHENLIERSEADLKHQDNPTRPEDIELSSVPTQPEGLNTFENKGGLVLKRKKGNHPTAKELTKIKKKDIFSE